MAMVIAQPDINKSFSGTGLSQVQELLPSASACDRDCTHIDMDHSNASCSTSSTDIACFAYEKVEEGPIIIRLLSQGDVLPIVLGYLDIRSLLALSSISPRFRREILMPATPNLCYINTFLHRRAVVCSMAQFEGLKDFMAKYRSFKPLHLHFTYSEQSSLMSLVPEVSGPIYNSKADTRFVHPSSSPLTTSHLFGVNQSISINITSTNSLYQHHHPLQQQQQLQQQLQQQQQDQQQQQQSLQVQLLHTQPKNDQSEAASSSHPSSLTTTSALMSTINVKAISTDNTQHSHIHQRNTTHVNSSSYSNSTSANKALIDTFESSGDRLGRGTAAEVKNSGKTNDLEARAAATSITHSGDTPTVNTATAARSISDVADSLQYQQQQLFSNRSVNYYINNNGNTSSSSSSSNHTPNHSRYGGMLDIHHHSTNVSMLSDSIPVLSSTSTAISPPVSGYHGFELSYWQKFALNELFMRLLPFLRTLTIGRTDKPSRKDRDQAPNKGNGELSAGVCFFLARCFNVMHDMPDTALESVLWMDVTAKDVILLTTMIDLRDIMVDERYWKREYWAVDRPLITSRGQDQDEDSEDDVDMDNDGGDWDGFYYLCNQEGVDKRSFQPKKKTSLPFMSAAVGKETLRKSNTMRGSSSSASSSSSSSAFSKQTIAPLTSHQQGSGLNHPVKGTSSSSAPSTTVSSPSRSAAGKKNRRSMEAPATWQGFSEGALETTTHAPIAEEYVLPPAVQLFEALKAEIASVGTVPRFVSKSRNLITWPSDKP
ncbi:hypothetical protein BGX28_009730 [Mortierella sp. GBA30]|nr:hypothetical protein BGX28_009730 [Mortierella sp. GBA30]